MFCRSQRCELAHSFLRLSAVVTLDVLTLHYPSDGKKKKKKKIVKKMGLQSDHHEMAGHEQGTQANDRGKLVCREETHDQRLDLISVTLPKETLRFLCSMCARCHIRRKPHRLAVTGIKRSYFYAPARKPIFIDIPKDDLQMGDERCVGQLHVSLCGTRDATQNWAHEYTTFHAGSRVPSGPRATLQIC